MQTSKFVESLQKVKDNHNVQTAKRSLQQREFNLGGLNKKPRNSEAEPTNFDAAAVDDSDPMFPKIRLVSRYRSREDMAQVIPPHTDTLTITELYKQVSPPEFKRPPNSNPNFVVFGIVATRSVTRTSSRGTKFVTLVLSDLKYDISLALHGKAHDKFWKVRPGTLVALFNPQFYVQKFENTARTLALSVSKESCLVEIGQAKDLGQCEAMTSASKNSKRCKNWVDVRKSHVCDFHVEQKATRTKRPELNASSAKLWDPKNGGGNPSTASRLAVFEGGEVSWKRGLQVDTQASGGQSFGNYKKGFHGFAGFADAPIGRVFQRDIASNRQDPAKYEESLMEKKRRQEREVKQLEQITNDARLKSQLQMQASSSPRVSKTNGKASVEPKGGKIFARTQLRKLGFNPLSLASSNKPPGPAQPQHHVSILQNNAQNESDSDDLEII